METSVTVARIISSTSNTSPAKIVPFRVRETKIQIAEERTVAPSTWSREVIISNQKYPLHTTISIKTTLISLNEQ